MYAKPWICILPIPKYCGVGTGTPALRLLPTKLLSKKLILELLISYLFLSKLNVRGFVCSTQRSEIWAIHNVEVRLGFHDVAAPSIRD